MSEQEESVGVDLTAWEPPPPAPGLADAVIAKMREPVPASAIESAEPSRLRWWIAGGVVAAAAVALVVFATRDGEPLTGSGAVVVAKPSRIDLGAASSADLEANTDVRWVRDGHRLVAMQPRGTVSWRVSPDDKLVIDAGATVASVVASGASLRVEVRPMHVTEARLMAGSAVISAAVALVTVIVYEGRVEVTGGGKTTTVAPGATVEIRPLNAPDETANDLVAQLERQNAEIQRLVAELDQLRKHSDDDNRRRVREAIAEKQRQFDELERKLKENTDQPAGRPVKRLAATDIEKMMAANRAAFRACAGDYDGKVKVVMNIAASGAVTNVEIATDDAPTDCLAKVIRRFKFGASTGGTFAYTLVLAPDRTATVKTDPKNLCADVAMVSDTEAKADANQSAGNFAAALAGYKMILKCKPSVMTKAYLASCRARSFAEAKAFYRILNKESLAMICMKEGFDPRQP